MKVYQDVVADYQIIFMVDVLPELRVIDVRAAEGDQPSHARRNRIVALAAIHFRFYEVTISEVTIHQANSRRRVASPAGRYYRRPAQVCCDQVSRPALVFRYAFRNYH